MAKELLYTQLKNFFETENFVSSEKIAPYGEIIGQSRAEEAVEFALNINKKGYNVYILGESGSGRTTLGLKYANKVASTKKVPMDTCYIYNFNNPKQPKYIQLEAGIGVVFKKDMEDLIRRVIISLRKLIDDKPYLSKKADITKKYQQKRDEILNQLTMEAKEQNFSVKTSNTGIYFVPIVDGVVIGEEQFDDLSEDVKNEISANSEGVQQGASKVMQIIKEDEEKSKDELKNLEYSESLFIVGNYINALCDKYKNNKIIIDYLLEVKEDILDNLSDFYEETEDNDAISSLLPWSVKVDESFIKYTINVLVDNTDLTCAPVITSHDISYSKLIGEIDFDTENGNLITDFTQIKAGLLHKANGGFIILNAHELLINPSAYDGLRQSLINNEISIESQKELATGISISSLKPEPIKLDVKVILVGSSYFYELMSEYDEQFEKLFKIVADIDYEMDCNKEYLEKMSGYIKNFVISEHTLDFDNTAILKVMEYSSRLAGSQKKLSTNFSQIKDLLIEADTWARMDNENIITEHYVKKAIDKKIKRLSLYEEKLTEMIDDEFILIETSGERIGQINGLAVIDMGGYMFGKPTKITATTYVGRLGIVNIEKESDLSGSIHDKGLQIIEGFLGQTFAQDFPLSISSKICFEQNYSGIDGDSASSTELYCLISSIAALPIKQNIAVTGSVNQYGLIQPIGGVTQKIEGFYDLCNKRGLDGTHGVIIPIQNVSDLTLNDEVIEAVKNNLFHIYPVQHVNEGLEILLELEVGTKNEKGKYEPTTIYGKVYKKLKKLYLKANEE